MSAMQALNRLCKWRSIFAGWQLGTRPNSDPECQAVRDHREVTIIMRAELSTLAGLLIDKGVITHAEWDRQLEREANQLSEDYERKFPGARASDNGIVLQPEKVHGWMSKWRP